MSELNCKVCGKPATIRIDGRCVNCNPFDACRKCDTGTYHSKPTAAWQNRFVCDQCGDKVSK